MTNETLARIDAGVQTEGVGYLRELAASDPALFLELIALVLTDEEGSEDRRRPIGEVRFMYKQQTGSDNQT